MTARACFTGKIAAGLVDAEAGRIVLDELDRLEADFVAQAGRADAARAAAAAAQSAAAHRAWREEQTALNAIRGQLVALRALAAYGDTVSQLRGEGRAPLALAQGGRRLGRLASLLSLNGESALGAALRSLLTKDPHEIATWANVEFVGREVRGLFWSGASQAIDRMRPKMLGLKDDIAGQLDVLRALYDAPSATPDGRLAAQGLSERLEWLRMRFVEAGGWIPKREAWRLPNPSVDPVKVRSVTADEFRARTLPRLDREAMVSFETGQRLTDAELDDLLSRVHATMAADGLDPTPSAAFTGRGALSEARDAPRVLIFRDADAWLGHLNDFGRGTVWDAITGHVHALSREIGALQTLGNPETFRRFALSLFDREANRLAVTAGEGADPAAALAHNRRLAAEVAGDRSRFVALLANATGMGRDPVGNLVAAQAFATQRDLLRASALGSAVVSSLADAGSLLMTARFNGLPMMDVQARFFANLAKGDAEISLRQLGVVADAAARSIHDVDRFLGEEIGAAKTARLSGAVLRASLLERWTEAGRAAFAMEMTAQLANRRTLDFAAADAAFRGALGRYGVTPAEWAQLRDAPVTLIDGAPFLSPAALDAAGHGALAGKLLRMMHQELDHAVVENIDPAVRALTLGTSAPGTAGGEMRRAVAAFKGTPTQIMLQMMFRATARGWDGTRLSHGALTFLTMSGLGVLAMQAKEMAKGRDPLTLDPATKEGRAALFRGVIQGGGFGVFGDMIAQDKTRFGNSWATMLAGPQFSQAEAVLGSWLLANVRRAATGETTHFLGDALYVGAQYVPGQSLWYARAAFQRAVVDQATRAVDERAPERFHRMERAAARAFHQDHWWRPGSAAPDRAPALTGTGP